jgi:signal recognition particle subunit SEC65
MALRRIAVAVIPLLCGLECASAAPRWLKLNSANFELFTTAGERRGRDAILYFEQVRGLFLKATHSSGGSALPVRIVAFSSDKEYQPYRASEAAAAYAMGGHDRDYIVLSGTGSENYPVAVHEYVHLLMKPVGKRVQVGDILPGRFLVLQQSKWLNLETLIAIDHNSPYYNEKSRASVFYAEAWALTHMLMLTEPYRAKLPQFLVAVRKRDEARQAFAELARQNPLRPEVEEAVKHLEQVQRVDREEAYPLFQALAHAYHQLGNQAGAIAAAEQARQVMIIYEPKVDGEFGTIGVVKTMEFK